MTRHRAAIAATVVAVTMALAGAAISHTGQTKAAQTVASGDEDQPEREMSS